MRSVRSLSQSVSRFVSLLRNAKSFLQDLLVFLYSEMASGNKCVQNGSSDPMRFRVVIMGQGKVGKTAILRRFLTNEFVEKYKETVDDLQTKTYDVNGLLIKADILDTAGNLSFPAMRRLNISTGQAFILVYCVDSTSSFQEIQQIFQEIQDIRGQNESKSLPIVVVRNKIDIDRKLWQVQKIDVEEFMLSKTLDFSATHLETSAKLGQNVKEVFEELVKLSHILDSNIIVPEVQNLSAGPQRKLMLKPQRRLSLQTHSTLASFPLATLTSAKQLVQSAGTSPVRRTTMNSCDGTEQLKMQMQAMHVDKGRRKGSLPAGAVKPRSLSRQSSRGGILKKQKSRNGEDISTPECFIQ